MELTTKENLLATEFATRVGEELANEHSEILQTYFPHFVIVKSHCEKSLEIEERFHAAKTDDERLDLAPLAKAMSIAFSKVTGKDGIKPLKPQLKAYTASYNKTVDGCHNHIEALKKEGQSAMQNIASYADIVAQKVVDALTKTREDEVACIGGTDFLYQYQKLGNYDADKFDEILNQIHTQVEGAKAIAELAKAKAQQEADKDAVRDLRGNALATVSYFHAGDLSDLSEVDFLNLLTSAKKKFEADKIQAKAKQEQDKAQAIKVADQKAEQAKVDAEKAKQALALQTAETLKAKQEAKRLADEQAVRNKEAKDLEAEKQRKLQGSDLDKVSIISEKLRELSDTLTSMEFQSEKGGKMKAWVLPKVNELNSVIFKLKKQL